MQRLPVLAAALLLPFSLSALPAAAASASFGRWIAVCDNGLSCSAYGFATMLDETMTGAWVRLWRGAEADALPKAHVGFSLAAGGAAEPLRITFEPIGPPSGPLPIEEGDNFFFAPVETRDVGALIEGLGGAVFMNVRLADAAGRPMRAAISLDGVVPALRWIDEQQQRAGTEAAMVDRGFRRTSPTSSPPSLPEIRRATPTAPVAQALPDPIVDLVADGLCAGMQNTLEPIVADLGGSTLYGTRCSAGAYSSAAEFWIARAGGPPLKAEFALPQDFTGRLEEGGRGAEGVLPNPIFDERTMTLTARSLDRGLGDCGTQSEWVWDGYAFQLASLRAMHDCEGIPEADWPTVYRARVE